MKLFDVKVNLSALLQIISNYLYANLKIVHISPEPGKDLSDPHLFLGSHNQPVVEELLKTRSLQCSETFFNSPLFSIKMQEPPTIKVIFIQLFTSCLENHVVTDEIRLRQRRPTRVQRFKNNLRFCVRVEVNDNHL